METVEAHHRRDHRIRRHRKHVNSELPDIDRLRQARSVYYADSVKKREEHRHVRRHANSKPSDVTSSTTRDEPSQVSVNKKSSKARDPQLEDTAYGRSRHIRHDPSSQSKRRRSNLAEKQTTRKEEKDSNLTGQARSRINSDHTIPISQVKPMKSRKRSSNSTTIAPKPDSKRSSGFFANLFRTKPIKPASKPITIDCLTCSTNISSTKAATLDCGHNMCHHCLKRIFTLSTTDPTHMPPRCCTSTPIPLSLVSSLFSPRFKRLWNKKYTEYSTPRPLYCPRKQCSAFIPRPSSKRIAKCPVCKSKVCVPCGCKHHGSDPCRTDESFATLAKQNGWQRCPECRAVVELKEGCNHMTCRCRAEFCMLCGEKWKGCGCPLFSQGGTGMQFQQADADEILARGMQMALLLEAVGAGPWGGRMRTPVGTEVWGVGNAAGMHHMNEHFVREVPVPGRVAVDGAEYGRRGERESGRRRSRPRVAGHDAGLTADAFGDASVLGVGPSRL